MRRQLEGINAAAAIHNDAFLSVNLDAVPIITFSFLHLDAPDG